MLLCHCAMLKNKNKKKQWLRLQIKVKSLKFTIHTSLLGYCSSSTGYKSENTSFRLPQVREG